MPIITCHMPCLKDGKEQKFISVFCTSNSVEELQYLICDKIGTDDFYLVQNGRRLQENGRIGKEPIRIALRTLGGKGGFGSMLRAIGAQIEKTTNREACRDLSGRRLRDINEEQRLKNWIAQQAARENEAKDRKRVKLEKLLKEPSHNFEDQSYEQERSHLLERVADAFEQGVEAGPSSAPKSSSPPADVSNGTNGKVQKRKLENKNCGPREKKSNLLWIDDLSCSEEDDESEEDSGFDENNRNEPKDCGEEAGTQKEINQQNVESIVNGSPNGNQSSKSSEDN